MDRCLLDRFAEFKKNGDQAYQHSLFLGAGRLRRGRLVHAALCRPDSVTDLVDNHLQLCTWVQLPACDCSQHDFATGRTQTSASTLVCARIRRFFLYVYGDYFDVGDPSGQGIHHLVSFVKESS